MHPVLEAMQRRLDRQPGAMSLRRSSVEHVFGTLKFADGSLGLRCGACGNTAPDGGLPTLLAPGCRCCWRGGRLLDGPHSHPAGAELDRNRLGKPGSNATQAGESQASETFYPCPVGMRKLCQGPAACSNPGRGCWQRVGRGAVPALRNPILR